MRPMPRDPSPDSTLAFLRDGYRFISTRCDRYGSDVFETRLLLEPTICLRGADGARIFYDPDRFQRSGALPGRVQRSLVGVGGVQVLDGAAHRARKQLLLAFMTPSKAARVAERFGWRWLAALDGWACRRRIVLHDAVAELLCRTACDWVGVPLSPAAPHGRGQPFHRVRRARTASPAAVA